MPTRLNLTATAKKITIMATKIMRSASEKLPKPAGSTKITCGKNLKAAYTPSACVHPRAAYGLPHQAGVCGRVDTGSPHGLCASQRRDGAYLYLQPRLGTAHPVPPELRNADQQFNDNRKTTTMTIKRQSQFGKLSMISPGLLCLTLNLRCY